MPNYLEYIRVKILLNLATVSFYSYLILLTSIFIYVTIYNIYIPVVQHTRPIHLQFDSTCQDDCSNPNAVVNLSDVRSSMVLARGQSYRFIIALEMPESDINWSQGMFMIRLRLVDSRSSLLYDVSRPAIMRYKTPLTRIINALLYSPFLVTNLKNEMQTMHVQLIDNYIEGAKFSFSTMDRALITIIARDIQIYSAHLYVSANLSGLSYYMYYWPMTSAALGVATLASFMAILSVYRGQSSSAYQSMMHYSTDDYDEDENLDIEEESVSQEADSSSGSLKELQKQAQFTGEID